MLEEQFKTLMRRIDESYPSQPKYNMTQKAVFWAALRDFDYQDLVVAFIEHSKVDEWKPQVPAHLIKHLKKQDLNLRDKFQKFFDRKPLNDDLADKIIDIMGRKSLRKSTEKEFEQKLVIFTELYQNHKTKESFVKLPDKIKNKLIGLKK
tara:strand:- start:57 stop:506 length:450 start_codon:yes stop_codon:yes gene_type:complete